MEHIGMQVPDPAAMGDWYVRHLGFTVRRAADHPVPVRFLADASGAILLEIYRNPEAGMPDYAAMDPLVFHVAFACDDVAGERQRLMAAGATPVWGPEDRGGDIIAVLRDPWGVPVQLVRRKTF